MKRDHLLLIADSESDADMLYASGVRLSEPFIFLSTRGKKWIAVGEADWERAQRGADVDRVISLEKFRKECLADGCDAPSLGEVAGRLLRRHRVKKVYVPPRFPLGFARELRALKIRVKLRTGAFFPDRQFKTADELKRISAALTMAEIGMSEGIQALKRARIDRRGRLLLNGNPLGADRLRAIMECAVFDAGGTPAGTVVACGAQACDPHERGHGMLKANTPIILDIAPRSQKTGYHGRVARTVVRGTAREAVRRLFEAVRTAQELAFQHIQPGANCAGIADLLAKHFVAHGYETQRGRRGMSGVLHGVGRGLGLELVEPPGVNGSLRTDFRSGHVLAVRPALYYPGIGAARLEDVVHVTPRGMQNLTRFEKVLEV